MSQNLTSKLTIAVIGAGGRMGMRVSNNLHRTDHTVFYSEASPAGRERVRDPDARSPTPTPRSRTPTSSSSPCQTSCWAA